MLGLGTICIKWAQPSAVRVKSWPLRGRGCPLAIQEETSQAWAERLASSWETAIRCPRPLRRRSRKAASAARAAWTPAWS